METTKKTNITVATTVNAPVAKVWEFWIRVPLSFARRAQWFRLLGPCRTAHSVVHAGICESLSSCLLGARTRLRRAQERVGGLRAAVALELVLNPWPATVCSKVNQ